MFTLIFQRKYDKSDSGRAFFQSDLSNGYEKYIEPYIYYSGEDVNDALEHLDSKIVTSHRKTAASNRLGPSVDRQIGTFTGILNLAFSLGVRY